MWKHTTFQEFLDRLEDQKNNALARLKKTWNGPAPEEPEQTEESRDL